MRLYAVRVEEKRINLSLQRTQFYVEMDSTKGGKMLEQHLDQILSEIRELLIKKNKDYGDSNLREGGIEGIILRVQDKVSRIKHIGSTNGLVGEAAEKEWLDIAGYAIQAIRLMRED